MSYHQGTIAEIKGILLDLWLENPKNHPYSEWFEALNKKITQYFQIHKADCLVYHKTEKNFVPIGRDESVSLDFLCVSGELLAYNKQEAIRQMKALGYDYADDFLLFRCNSGEPLALLLMETSTEWGSFSESPYVKELEEFVSRFIEKVSQINELIIEEEKFKLLFNITESFTSTMTSGTILDHMLNTAQGIVPNAKISVILSREPLYMTHPYKIFNQVESNPSEVNAFLNGIVTAETIDGTDKLMVNAPIKGNQGVYGVLKLEASIEELSSNTRKELIRILVNTAGSALENASLYNQSHRLNEDLRLVNETSKKLNSSLTMNEMLVYLKQQLEKVLSPSEMLFMFYNEAGERELIGTNNDVFQKRTGKEYLDYISNYIRNGKVPLFDADFNHMSMESHAYKSIIGIPILHQEEVIGVAICLHEDKYFFSFDNFKLMESIIIHASLSISNLQLREKMQELAEKDHLTDLYARRYLEKHIYHIVSENKGGSFLLFDIDNFKIVNDKYGHDIGDNVLQQIGECLLREVGDGGIAARWGGEEFAVYLPTHEKSRIEETTQKLLAIIPAVTKPSVTVSIGLVHWEPEMPQSFKALFKEADTMLYLAKKQGKNQLVFSH